MPARSTTLEPISVHAAEARIRAAALWPSSSGRVGLELEGQLVDLAAPGRRVGWQRIADLVPVIEAAAGSSAVTFEPGGQVELSGRPASGIAAAAGTMRAEAQRVRLALAEHELGLAWLGTDPLRPPRRVHPGTRYRAMEQHFRSRGRAHAGATMMCASAALQVNLDAGPEHGWADRVALAQQLGPVLCALAACSRWLSGRDTGLASAREAAWQRLRPAPPTSTDPAGEWARYALAAPVMFVRRGPDDVTPVVARVPLRDWLTGRARLDDRLPSAPDVELHLSTLFPPVRMRGYLEIRYLDVSPPRWWPALAATVAVLLDDPRAADAAREAVEPARHLWREAARDGLRDPRLATAARRCVELAASHAPAPLRLAVEDLAELATIGRGPGDLVAERVAEVGPAAAFAELARA